MVCPRTLSIAKKSWGVSVVSVNTWVGVCIETLGRHLRDEENHGGGTDCVSLCSKEDLIDEPCIRTRKRIHPKQAPPSQSHSNTVTNNMAACYQVIVIPFYKFRAQNNFHSSP